MAITKTVFTGATLAANAPEVLAFLQANAAGYFDSITADENGNVICSIDEVDVLKIGFDGTMKTKLTLANGESIENNNATGGNGTRPFTYGYACAGGVMLWDSGGSNIIITKSDGGSAALAAVVHNTTNTSKPSRVVIGDVSNDLSWFTLSSDTYATAAAARAVYVINGASALTAMVPLLLGDGGTYAPDLFSVPYSENGGITSPKKLIYGGDEYIYDGAFALKG